MIIKHKTFKEFISEVNAAGAGGVFGTANSMGHGGAVGNSDFYAPGDARIPVALGAKKVGKKRKLVVQKRPFAK